MLFVFEKKLTLSFSEAIDMACET